MAKLIKTDGTIQKIADKVFELEELQKFVGGYIELVYLPGSELMVVNEEGYMKSLEINETASDLAKTIIVGNVLVCNSKCIK